MASSRGFSSFAATVLAGLALALALFFMWSVWKYYGQITGGQASQLPQFGGQFTAASNAASGASGTHPEVATDDDPSFGPKDAKLTVVEFLDYQCPFCGEESSALRELSLAYGDRVRFIIRDFPVEELHPDALAGAEAAGCVEAQDQAPSHDKFWSMHDHLFALKGVWTRQDLEHAAEQSGADMDVFKACMATGARKAEIQSDETDGVNAGVRGTPTFFFNGAKVEGVIPKDVFETLIKRFIAS